MIKFIESEVEDQSKTLADVPWRQFFVDANGYFCQKRTDNSYIRIADEWGRPYSTSGQDAEIITHKTEVIRRILPRIEKIEF